LFRYSMLFATFGAVAVAAHLVACGGDDAPASALDAGTGGTEDAGTTGPVLTISDTRSKVYLGQTAKLDGARIAPNITTEIAWKVVAAPQESAITTESLHDASTSTPSFTPDRLGTYTLQVSGSKDGVATSVIVLIEAVDAPVFWREGRISQVEGSESASSSLSTHVGGVNGTRNREIDCPITFDGGSEGTVATLLLYTGRFGAALGDTWEAPPGSASRVAFIEFMGDPGSGAGSMALSVATSESTCGAGDAKHLDSVSMDGGGGGEPSAAIYGARFSPDGNRIAYLHDVDGRSRIATIGFDGSAKRDLSPFQSAGGDAGLDPDARAPLDMSDPVHPGQVTPRWKDNTHVGWVTFVQPDGADEGAERSAWELYVAEDKEGATAELAMRCSDSNVQTFDFLPDGSIVAAARHLVTGDEGEGVTMNVLVYRANPTTKSCEIVRNLTGHTESDQIARDVALSPDKSTVAFFAGRGTGSVMSSDNQLVLSTAPVDGSRPAAPVPGTSIGADPGSGPRWAAGGTSLTWGQIPMNSSGGAAMPGASRLVSIPATGGEPRLIADTKLDIIPEADGGQRMEARVAFGIGQGCSASPGAVSNGVVLAGGAVGIAALFARRRRRS